MLGTFNKIISNLWSSRGETDVDAKLLKLSHDKSLACDLVNKLRFHLNLWIGVRSRLAHLFLSFEHSVGRWSSLMDAHNSFNMIRLIIHVRSKSLTRISAEQRFLTHVEHFFMLFADNSVEDGKIISSGFYKFLRSAAPTGKRQETSIGIEVVLNQINCARCCAVKVIKTSLQPSGFSAGFVSITAERWRRQTFSFPSASEVFFFLIHSRSPAKNETLLV